MQMLLFAAGEGVCGRILASDNISLNANLAKYREQLKEFLTELSKLCQSKALSCFSGHS